MPTHGLVLTAAGASTRFGGGPSKVLRPLAGVPVLARAARAFREALGALPTVVTGRPEDLEALRALVRSEPALAGAVVVTGGETRQASVAAGVFSLPPGVDVVFVHDAARPLVSPDLVRRVADAAARAGAAAPDCSGVVLTEAHAMADAGLNLVFSDGHRRGIYPWAYLRELEEGES